MNDMTLQQKFSAGLREVADWYDRHPNAPLPSPDGLIEVSVYGFNATPDEMKAVGAGRKEYPEGYGIFRYWVDLNHAKIKFVASRSKVCTAKVVGFREIPEQHIEAHVIPAKREEIVEWECRGSLLASETEQEGKP